MVVSHIRFSSIVPFVLGILTLANQGRAQNVPTVTPVQKSLYTFNSQIDSLAFRPRHLSSHIEATLTSVCPPVGAAPMAARLLRPCKARSHSGSPCRRGGPPWPPGAQAPRSEPNIFTGVLVIPANAGIQWLTPSADVRWKHPATDPRSLPSPPDPHHANSDLANARSSATSRSTAASSLYSAGRQTRPFQPRRRSSAATRGHDASPCRPEVQ